MEEVGGLLVREVDAEELSQSHVRCEVPPWRLARVGEGVRAHGTGRTGCSERESAVRGRRARTCGKQTRDCGRAPSIFPPR